MEPTLVRGTDAARESKGIKLGTGSPAGAASAPQPIAAHGSVGRIDHRMNTPILAARLGSSAPTGVRRLTKKEIAYDEAIWPLVNKAKNKFKLFKLLELNFKDWKQFHRTLLTPGYNEPSIDIALDRLLFNFLATAYGLTEHFKCTYRQKFRKDEVALTRYDRFIDGLCEKEWAVAFFMDFRNFVQHRELPIGGYNRWESDVSVRIAVTQDSAELVSQYRDWTRSKLTAEHGTLDLIQLTSDYFHILSHEYGTFMAKVFFPDLKGAHDFYAGLAREVAISHPHADVVIVTSANMTPRGALATLEITSESTPSNVFSEMGIAFSG